MKRLIFQRFFLLLSVSLSFGVSAQGKAQLDTILMGSTFRFVVYERDSVKAKKGMKLAVNEVIRVENLLSDWRPQTPVGQINQNAGIRPVSVDAELFSLLNLAKKYSAISDGLFDITYAGMEKIWRFDGSMTAVPTESEVKKALAAVGDRFLVLDEVQSSAFLKNPKSRISFGSIGKAYGGAKAAEILRKNGYRNFMVDASGDIVLAGKPERKNCWKIGIFQPNRGESYKMKCLRDISIVTSGDYEKFALLEGKRYGHIINPKTGYPSTEIASVTALGPDAVTANFLTTTSMLASKSERNELLKKIPGYRLFVQKNKKVKEEIKNDNK